MLFIAIPDLVGAGVGGSGPSLRPEARVVRVRSGEGREDREEAREEAREEEREEAREDARERGSSCLTRVTAAPPPPASRSSSGLIGCSVPRMAGPGPGSVSCSGVASRYFCNDQNIFENKVTGWPAGQQGAEVAGVCVLPGRGELEGGGARLRHGRHREGLYPGQREARQRRRGGAWRQHSLK